MKILVATVLMCLTGCGYPSYVAYYLPAEKTSLSFEEKRSYAYHLLSKTVNDAEVRVMFYGLFEYGKASRDCFNATVNIFSNSSEVDSTVPMGGRHVAVTAVVDSMIITCKSPGLSETLPVRLTYEDLDYTIYESEGICLSRKHKKLLLQFQVRIITGDGSTLASENYELELERWEIRNWLGLE